MNTKLKTMSILRDFHNVTGSRVSIFDLDFNEICGFPEKVLPFCTEVQKDRKAHSLCVKADKKAFETVLKTQSTYTYRCHCGLIEVVAPIYHYGVLSGYFMMGQISDTNTESRDSIIELSKKYFPGSKQLEQFCDRIPKVSRYTLDSYINILQIIAEYMTETHRIAAKHRDLAGKTMEYINKNYAEKITVEKMCEIFGCSRTTLFNSFREKYRITIGDYIVNHRTAAAADMLKNSTESIGCIAEECGIPDRNYFSKVFYGKYGCTPREYRKNYGDV